MEKLCFLVHNSIKAGKMLMMIKSRIHVVRLRVSEFHPYWDGMNVIQLSRTPAFSEKEISAAQKSQWLSRCG